MRFVGYGICEWTKSTTLHQGKHGRACSTPPQVDDYDDGIWTKVSCSHCPCGFVGCRQAKPRQAKSSQPPQRGRRWTEGSISIAEYTTTAHALVWFRTELQHTASLKARQLRGKAVKDQEREQRRNPREARQLSSCLLGRHRDSAATS